DALAKEVTMKVDECKADGVIVATAKFCHSALNDGTEIVKTCEKHGIPYLKMEFEEDLTIFEKFRMQVEALMEARRILPFAGTEKRGGGSK
ncbi:MAG: 2-hydroxyacyl-CoA dehydratase family protein, partial [bacterium]